MKAAIVNVGKIWQDAILYNSHIFLLHEIQCSLS